MTWSIVCRRSHGTMAVAVRSEKGHEDEVCRVGLAREDTKQPEQSYEDVLDGAIRRARQAVLTLNNIAERDGEIL